jgi:hypothetical protein
MAEHLWHYPADGEEAGPYVVDMGLVQDTISKSDFRGLSYEKAKAKLLEYLKSKMLFPDQGEDYVIAEPCDKCGRCPREKDSLYCDLCPIAIEMEQLYHNI